MFDKIERELFHMEKPGRYIGNESGIPDKNFVESEIRFAISYPDLYEIGMSNQGIKILYDIINGLDYAACERVFSPWYDMEEFLRTNELPLFSLESKSPLSSFDFVGFNIQYELLLTNFINILELGGIPVLREERGEDSPFVICGGPVTANPGPLTPFTDIFVIGEGEAVIRLLLARYRELKGSGAKREEILRELSEIDGVYVPTFTKGQVKRQVYMDFVNEPGPEIQLIPNIDPVQNKLVVEIMRGCPNKCRFCQAGVIYKPYRERTAKNIMKTIDKGLQSLGINEVTLASLSSGDYSNILELTDLFNKRYGEKGISISLPSLKVESFDIDLLKKLSIVRKSGLTFAVETGDMEGQISLNKPVLMDKVLSIIDYAVDNGWRLIKLYFMIGLPHIENEIEKVQNFLDGILKKYRKLKINLNIGVFVPKSHTPYQDAPQMPLEESTRLLREFKEYYKRSRVRVKYHDPYMSYVEGFIARGDEKVGLAVYDVFRQGARFDGWDSEFRYERYEEAFCRLGISYEGYLAGKNTDGGRVWDIVDVGLSDDYLHCEDEKGEQGVLTESCKEGCEESCTICRHGVKKVEAEKETALAEESTIALATALETPDEKEKTQYFLEFEKVGLLKYTGHRDMLGHFERFFRRSGIDLYMTQGFNPHPKFQFSPALPLGIESKCEILEFFTNRAYDEEALFAHLKYFENPSLRLVRLKRFDNCFKSGLINRVFLSNYILNFDKVYYNDIYKKVMSFNEEGLSYRFERKKRVIEGNYQDLVEFNFLDEGNLELKVKYIEGSPKVTEIVKDIFNEIPINIIKSAIYTNNKGELIKLFDIEG